MHGEQTQDDGQGMRNAEEAIAQLNVQSNEGPTIRVVAPAPDSLLGERVQRLEQFVESEFLRRETRLIPSLMGLWTHIQGGPKDPKARAAVSAFLWRLFSPGTTAAAGGILLLAITVVQAMLIARQNTKLDQQTHLMQAQANVAVSSQVGDLVSKITEHGGMACLSKEIRTPPERPAGKLLPNSFSKEAHLYFRSQLPECWQDVPSSLRPQWLNACIDDRLMCRKFLFAARQSLSEELQQGERSGGPSSLPLPPGLQAQVVALTNLARPYRFVDVGRPEVTQQANLVGVSGILNRILVWFSGTTEGAPSLTPRAVSPERGVILVQLLVLGHGTRGGSVSNADFSSAYVFNAPLSGVRFADTLQDALLPYASFKSANLSGVFYRSDMPCADFEGANLEKLAITQGDFSGVNFDNSKLPPAKLFNPSQLHGASFEGATVTAEDFLKELAARNIPGFESGRWRMRSASKDSWRIERTDPSSKTAGGLKARCV